MDSADSKEMSAAASRLSMALGALEVLGGVATRGDISPLRRGVIVYSSYSYPTYNYP